MNDALALVLVGHLLGDWIVQTDWEAANKATSWKANQWHMFSYHLTLLLCLGPVLWGWPLVTLMAMSYITHTVIDRRWPVKWLMDHTRSARFATTSWGPMCVDQALHISILLITLAIVA